MPEFRLREGKDNEIVNFLGGVGGNGGGYLKPKEIGRAIVSTPMDFYYHSTYGDGVWPRFGTTLKGLVTRAQDSRSLGLNVKTIAGKNQYRMILISDAPVQPEESKHDNHLVQLKMNLKLVSNISLEAPRHQREQGCLVQLTRLCGPQNVNIRIKSMGNNTKYFPWMEDPCVLSWNEEDLSWEGKTKVTFKNKLLNIFGSADDDNMSETTVAWITSDLEDDGVRNVLRSLYGGPGDGWKLQKQMLEQGTFSDLGIISLNPKNKTNPKMFQCHRVKLAEVSQVFADMLQGNWEEAQTRTIKLSESEDAIEAMLHFIYYGGADRIYKSREESVLELLQAGHKYNIKNLEEVAAFVLLTDNGRERLMVETALQTFFFARNVEGQLWKELRKHCFYEVRASENWERKRSKAWKELVAMAKKFGPEYSSLLNHLFSIENEKYTRKLLPGSLNGVKGIKKEEVELFYDLLILSPVALCYYTWDVAVAMFMVAEYLGWSMKEVEKKVKEEELENKFFGNLPLRCYQVDYLVELFCLARRREGEVWMELKMEAVKRLGECQTKQPKKVKGSLKFREMIEESAEASKEFGSPKEALELEDEEKERMKRRRLN